ncbi:TIR domain-containing protein [Trueperella pyogenes]|uniref:TIR domain-containing protein n=1 Tax=Trueperella pyogenes TaxID=1661 RepID=A0ABV3NE00_9ACTO
MAVFYSFHYERDVHRVQLVRHIGSIEGQRILNSQDWEKVKRRGPGAIEKWIDEQMEYKTAVVVLIGRETASRDWVQYEIQRAWDLRKPLLGIQIHGLSSMGTTDIAGADPFTRIGGWSGVNPGVPIFDPTQCGFFGDIDSKATYRELASKLSYWVTQGVTR